MLYHVPEPPAAVRELRRITHPAGQVLVVLNGEDHLRELRDLITAALGNLTNAEPPLRERLRLDDGEDLLASEFTSITRYDFTGELVIPALSPSKITRAAGSSPSTCPTPRHSPQPSASLSPPVIREYSGSELTAGAWSAHNHQFPDRSRPKISNRTLHRSPAKRQLVKFAGA